MDTQGRIDAALARLGANRAVLAKANEAGPPCSECVHGAQGLCGHPSYIGIAFSPSGGQVETTIQVPIEQARAEDGLCGPEAALFDPKVDLLAILEQNLPDIRRYAWLSFAWVLSSSFFGLFVYAFLLAP